MPSRGNLDHERWASSTTGFFGGRILFGHLVATFVNEIEGRSHSLVTTAYARSLKGNLSAVELEGERLASARERLGDEAAQPLGATSARARSKART